MKNTLHITITALIIASLLIPVTSATHISTTNKQIATTKNPQKTLLTNEQIFIKINKIVCHNNPDPWPWAEEADLKIKVTLEGETYSKTYDDDHNTITKSWIMSHTITENKDYIGIQFKLIDRDPDANDVCDINPDSEKKTCDITYNLAEDKWTGDDNGDGHIAGNSKPRCELWFEVWDIQDDDPDLDVDIECDSKDIPRVPVQFNAVLTGEGWQAPITWEWTIQNTDGQTIATLHNKKPTYTFTTIGKYTVTVEATDKHDHRATDAATITIVRPGPVISFPEEGYIYFKDHMIVLPPPFYGLPYLPHMFGHYAWFLRCSESFKKITVSTGDDFKASHIGKITLQEGDTILYETPGKDGGEYTRFDLHGLLDGVHTYDVFFWGHNQVKLAQITGITLKCK